jgi:UDP-N-acetylmuramate dehydrogenase
MNLQEQFSLRSKTTMRLGGTAEYFVELMTKDDADEVVKFAATKNLPLVLLGSGSNTVFADGQISAVVAQVRYTNVEIKGTKVTVGAGKNLPMLVNELAEQGLDLSVLTGIPGTLGGAIFGNAGEGPKGVWIDSFVETVTVRIDDVWKTLERGMCEFSYRESAFKSHVSPVLIWEAVLNVPKGDPVEIKKKIQAVLARRIETQPHLKTAGSCFKAVGGTPAWQMIDAVGLRGLAVGGIQIAPKHANFLLNTGDGTYADAVQLLEVVKEKIPENLEVEMRFVEGDGRLRF